MMTMLINEQSFWYALYDSTTAVTDSYGNETGDPKIVYKTPVQMSANISEASGLAGVQPFGTFTDYDKVIMTDWMDCPIDENSVLCVDREPEYTVPGGELIYDYVVRRVAKSLNSVSIAIAKVLKS